MPVKVGHMRERSSFCDFWKHNNESEFQGSAAGAQRVAEILHIKRLLPQGWQRKLLMMQSHTRLEL